MVLPTQRKKLSQQDKKKLVNALRRQDVGSVQRFLKRGWEPKEAIDGTNALNLVGGIRIAEVLLRAGADPNKDFGYLTPLAIHASAGDGKLVDYLLGMGADPDISSAGDPSQGVPKGTTPLMQSAKRGKLEVVKRLLRAGADANTVDSNRHNALFYALYFDKPDVAKELIQRGGKLTGDAIGGPVYHGNLELVKLLIKKKASVDCVFRSFEPKGLFIDGETPLGCAVSKVGQFDYPIEIIETLLRAGAKVDQPSAYFGETLPPICIAAGRGLEGIVQLLQKAGSELALKDALVGWTLEKACFIGRIGLVKLLLKSGAEINAPGFQGKMPLQIAHERGHEEIVKLLKQSGAKE